MTVPCAVCNKPAMGEYAGALCEECYRLSVFTPKPQGCICPPRSEQTCKNPLCPRGGHRETYIS